MVYDPHGVTSRWSGAARRGTLAYVAGALAALTALAFILRHLFAG